MRGSFWPQLAVAIVIVLAAIGIRFATGQDPTPSTPEPRQTLNIDLVVVMHYLAVPLDELSIVDDLNTTYKEVMVDEFTKWYPIAEGKTRVAIVGNTQTGQAGHSYVWGPLLDWSTDVAGWEGQLTTIHYRDDIFEYDITMSGAMKSVQDVVMTSRDSMRPKVVLFLSIIHNAHTEQNYMFDEAKVLVDSLKTDGVLVLMAVYERLGEAMSDWFGNAEKVNETFGSEFVYNLTSPANPGYDLPLNMERMKGLPAWIESRISSTFCNKTTDASFYNARHECKHGKYHPKLPLTVGDCETSDYGHLPEPIELCNNVTCDETCDRLWPLDVPCSASTCGDKAPKRQGPMKWNQLGYCPLTKICQECIVPTTVSVTVPTIAPVTSTTKPDSGGGIVDGSAVQQLIITIVASMYSMISG